MAEKKEKTNNSPLLVAIDDGYAQTKLFGDSPDGNGYKSFMMRSSIRQGKYGVASFSGEGVIGSYKTEEGEDYTVNESVESESTQFSGFHTSSMNRVLVNHALVEAGYGGKDVHLIAGLPLGDFFDDEGKINSAKIELKKKNLMKKVTNTVDGNVANIVNVSIGCQALAAFVDYWIDDNIKEKNVPIEKIAVVDIGGGTTDIALIIDGSSFDPKRSGTEKFGVLNVYNSLKKNINKRFDTSDKYPLAILDKAVRTGKIKLWGREEEITDLVNESIIEQQEQIKRDIQRLLGGASDVDAVLFVGGGSALFKDIAKIFPNGVSPENPEFANARGMYKYEKYFRD